MVLELSRNAYDVLWTEAEQQFKPITSVDGLETIYKVPPQLGKGYNRCIALQPGVELCIVDRTYQDVAIYIPENQHPVQFMVYLSGVADSGDFLYQDANWGYVGGSGIQSPVRTFLPGGQHQLGVNVHMQPHLLAQFFGTSDSELQSTIETLVPGNDRPQQVFSPTTTGDMRTVVQQIINCPFSGVTKRLYLQGKVFELMALQLSGLTAPIHQNRALKPETVARVQQAAAILRSHLESPTDQTTLARQVGVSDRTLRRGFKQLFGTTVLGYLIEQRLLHAERLLRDTSLSVTEVVHCCGYSNQGHFAATFKRRFGITPKQCTMGCKGVN
ncbi:helix-turn-helix transcriptional regulator [Leptolyngbya sp. Heron Island J]|uniref:helix-turn-helix transcriptional regulator n=1 Tax=Leptolyngbya sp. Heron Island J TaxID=1385935 RepID=UPI0004056A43|nr:AraC family transcriptional regulator [Leptolyngbya sp. Heron Island J]